jgi:23S rRNA pseudouridine955/2504/2580 synthase
MSGVRTIRVGEDEAELRLDRWFRRHFPGLTHGRLEKLLRTGQVRVDGGRAKASARLAPGQEIRVPPLGEPAAAPTERPQRTVSDADAEFVRTLVIHKDDQVLALNKPAGLAVQGGSGTTRHVDGMLDALRFEARERPRLAHRLDRDTSGVLLLGRTARATAFLARAFQGHEAHKTYWAITVGVPHPLRGRIDLALAKSGGPGFERMQGDEEEGKTAITDYEVRDHAAKKAAWLELIPRTGRTHQLRAHCAALGTPILGDGKYGGRTAMLQGVEMRRVHLHARAIEMPHPAGGVLRVIAPLPDFMRETWRFLGFELPS